MKFFLIILYYLILCLLISFTLFFFSRHFYFFIFSCSLFTFLLLISTFFSSPFLLAIFQAKNDRKFFRDINEIISPSLNKYNIRSLKIYFSSRYETDIFVIHDLFRPPSLVIGQKVFENLTKENLRNLIMSATQEVHSGNSFFKTSLTGASLFFLLPFFFIKRFKNENFRKVLMSFYRFFLFSPLLLRSFFLYLGVRLNFKNNSSSDALWALKDSEESRDNLALLSPLSLSSISHSNNLFDFVTNL